MIGTTGLNELEINGGSPEAGPAADDILEDVQATAEPLAVSRGSFADRLASAGAQGEVTSLVARYTQDADALAVLSVEVSAQVRAAAAAPVSDATVNAEPLTLTRATTVDLLETAGSDPTILDETATGPEGDELVSEIDREDTILQQHATFTQDVEDGATYAAELVSEQRAAVQDVMELEVSGADVILETPYYRQALEALASLEAAVVATHVAGSTDQTVDAAVEAEPDVLLVAASVDIDEQTLAEAQAVELQSDDILESATAAAGVPVDPITDDLSSWVWARDRVAGFFEDDVESVRVARDSVSTKLVMDIAVDVDALAAWVSERRGNRQALEALATADGYTEGVRSTSQDLDSEAYIGGAVITTRIATSTDIIEDTSATAERLLARLLRTQHVDVDANGRADVAGSVWFKSHSFIEEATAGGELVTETVRRPTKDDVAAEFGADANVEAAHLSGVAAWSEDTLAEAELLGNESGEAWVFNTRTLAFSRYVDFEATQVTTLNHRPAAVGARGLMRYAETFAEGYVKTGLSDYGSPQIKRMRHAYVTAASRAPIQLTTLQGIGDALQSTTYSVATLDSATPYTHRIDLARGDRGQFWAFELRAPAGHRTTLLNLRVQPLLTSRRI